MNPTIKFSATVRKVGNSNVVTVPADYVTNDLLKIGEEYTFTVNEGNNAS